MECASMVSSLFYFFLPTAWCRFVAAVLSPLVRCFPNHSLVHWPEGFAHRILGFGKTDVTSSWVLTLPSTRLGWDPPLLLVQIPRGLTSCEKWFVMSDVPYLDSHFALNLSWVNTLIFSLLYLVPRGDQRFYLFWLRCCYSIEELDCFRFHFYFIICLFILLCFVENSKVAHLVATTQSAARRILFSGYRNKRPFVPRALHLEAGCKLIQRSQSLLQPDAGRQEGQTEKKN